ncbi:MAG: methyltransferase domain-containing protein [Actinomycetota bacterium]|nr:methyltransferase domain-containing protein [Actinomycetota bacterium]MDQ3273577.1 methyltransferase domain-containing protein [Actinomycetota bacterium]
MSRLIERLKRTEDPLARTVLLHLRGAAHFAGRGHLWRRRAVHRHLVDESAPRLQIGSGGCTQPGWLNSDLIAGDIYIDLARRLPLPNRAFAFVFGEHVIEHLSEPTGMELLSELHRVLRPGGVVRLTTPDLRKIVAIYEDRNPHVSLADYSCYLDDITGKRHERGCQVLNDFFRLWGHRHLYDEEDLTAKLHHAGFVEVTRQEPGESQHDALRALERHGGEAWVNQAEAMCLEAVRGPG